MRDTRREAIGHDAFPWSEVPAGRFPEFTAETQQRRGFTIGTLRPRK